MGRQTSRRCCVVLHDRRGFVALSEPGRVFLGGPQLYWVSPQYFVGKEYQVLSANVWREKWAAMSDGESMYLIFNDYYAKLTKLLNDEGTVSYAKTNDGQFVLFATAAYGGYYRILAVSSEALEPGDVDALNAGLSDTFNIDMSTDLESNVRFSSAVVGYLEV